MESPIKYPKHACQLCGSARKLVETVIDDEFIWSEGEQVYTPTKFSDVFEHTGTERCANCDEDWTGL